MAAVPNHHQLHVWIDKRLHARLLRMAAAQKCTKAELVRMALRALANGLV